MFALTPLANGDDNTLAVGFAGYAVSVAGGAHFAGVLELEFGGYDSIFVSVGDGDFIAWIKN